jgi:acyl carrier protein
MEGQHWPSASGSDSDDPLRIHDSKGHHSVGTDLEKARIVIGDFLQRIDKGADGWNDDTELWGEGLGLDSLEAAELSAMLEDEFGTDPFSAGGDLPEKVGDVVAFYAAVST